MFSFFLHMSYIKWMVSVHKSNVDVLDLESNAIEEKVKMPPAEVSCITWHTHRTSNLFIGLCI